MQEHSSCLFDKYGSFDIQSYVPVKDFDLFYQYSIVADANGNGEIEIGDVTTILTIMAGN